MNILAITLSHPTKSAIGLQLGEYQSIQNLSPTMRGSDTILPVIDQILKSHNIRVSDLDYLVFDRGPGSFMGIRLAASVIQGLAMGTNLPIVPVSSLQALARWGAKQYPESQYFLASLDARQSERYWAVYQRQSNLDDPFWLEPRSPEQVTSAWIPMLTDPVNKNLIKKLDTAQDLGIEILELARRYYEQGYWVSSEQALPIYLRNRIT